MVGTSLIEKIKKGDKEELEKMYVKYRQEFIAWVCKSYGLPQEEAKDIYQFSVIKLYENIVSGQLVSINSSLKTYLFAIGKNKAFEYNRRLAKKSSLTFELDFLQEEVYSNYKADQLLVIERGLGLLGESCSELLKFYYYQKTSLEVLSQRLGYKNYDTIKSQKYKCLQRLKKICSGLLTELNAQ